MNQPFLRKKQATPQKGENYAKFPDSGFAPKALMIGEILSHLFLMGQPVDMNFQLWYKTVD